MNDKRLIDKGWRAMEALLDEHMPTSRRRRRIALWWLWLVMVGMGGALWQYYRTELQQQPTIPPLPERPVASEEVSPIGPFLPEPRAALTALPLEPLEQKSTPPPAVLHAQSSTPAALTAAAWRVSKADVVNLPPSPDAEDTAPMPLDASAPSVSSESKTPQSLTPLISSATMIQQTIQRPLLPLGCRIQVLEPPKSSAKRLSLGFSAGSFAQINTEGYGLAIGPTLDWRTNKRWGLRIGLTYRYTHLPGTRLTANTTAYLEYADIEQLAPNLPLLKADGVWVRLLHIHRLEVPLLIYGQIAPRLRGYAGVQGGALLGARVRSVHSFSGQYQALNVDKTHQLNSTVSARLFRWEGSAVAGVGYALSRRFELCAQVQWQCFDSYKRQLPPGGVSVLSPEFNWPMDAANHRLLLQISVFGKVY